MRHMLLALAGTAVLMTSGTFTAAEAAPFVPAPLASENRSLAAPIVYRSRCAGWARECSSRWGFANWRYRRCMVRHACY